MHSVALFHGEENSAPEFVFDAATVGFSESAGLSVENRLERLAYRVSCVPKSLRAHLERIHFCFRYGLNAHLYAALVDLLIILDRAGTSLALRMVYGSRSRLTDSQFRLLEQAVNEGASAAECLPPNSYTLFTQGRQSASVLIRVVGSAVQTEHDPLQLARDCLEYSQLDNAVRVLEQAILVQPERIELHAELLSLYRSTADRAGFEATRRKLAERGVSLPSEWLQTDALWKG